MNKFVRLLNEEDGDGIYGAGDGTEGTEAAVTQAPEGSDDEGEVRTLTREEQAMADYEAAEAAALEEKKAAAGKGEDADADTAAAAKGKTPALDEDAIAKVADAVASRMAPKPQAKKGFEITPEVIASLKPVRVTKDMLEDLFPEATDRQVAKMQQFANSIVENAVLTSRLINQQILEREKEQFAPIVNFYEAQQSEIAKKSFFEANKDIAKFPKFVSAAAARVSPNKADGSEKTAMEVAKEVADLTRAMLKEAIPTFGTDTANPDAAPKKDVPRMAQLNGAGRSLSGSQGKGKLNNPDADIYRDS